MALLLPRFPEGLRRFFATLGEGGPLELAEELYAVQLLPKDALLEAPIGLVQWRARVSAAAGGAGIRSGCAVRNPTGSSILTFVRSAFIQESQSYVLLEPFRTTPANYAGFGGARPLDMRLRVVLPADTFVSTVVTEIGTKGAGAATAGTIVRTGTVPANNMDSIPLGIILIPGSAVVIESNADNAAIAVTWEGYERHVRAEEARLQ